jgi:UDPglucose 6-dehydrogenase
VRNASGSKPRKVCIVGTGYVGTANAVGFAELGYDTVGYDVDSSRVMRLRAGTPPYRESGLEERLRKHVASGRLTFVTDFSAAVAAADFIIIAVGTPSREDGSADLSALESVVRSLRRQAIAHSTVVVLRSTVPPGTTDAVAARLPEGVEVIYCPEFLREGNAVDDFMRPDRTVIGAGSTRSAAAYADLVRGLQAPVMITSRLDAELIKGCSNAFLALKISFANEIANLCGSLEADARDVLRGVGFDHRIGQAYLTPGIGFGGPCFEKDVKSLDHVARRCGTESKLLSATLVVNEAQPKRIVDTLEEELGTLAGAHIGVWGLAFKAGTDDLRSSLVLRILGDLHARGASASAYDPAVRIADLPGRTTLANSAMEAADADALLVLTEWPEFAAVDPVALAMSLRRRVVVDGRNVLDAERMASSGLRYRGVGFSAVPLLPDVTSATA